MGRCKFGACLSKVLPPHISFRPDFLGSTDVFHVRGDDLERMSARIIRA